MSTTTPAAAPLPADLEQLLRRLRMPHTRAAAPDVLATARSQRWEPAEVLRAVFTAEVAGRDCSALATRRARAAFPTGKTFHAWKPETSSIPAPPNKPCAPWNGCTAKKTSSCADHPAPGKRSSSKRSASSPSNKAATSPGSPWKTSAA